MIRLGLKQAPYWLDLLPGVRLKVRPFTTALFFAAQQAVAKAPVPDEPDLADAMRGLAFIKALARLAIIEWEGVGNADGSVAAIAPPTVEALMDVWQAAASFERQYARPVAELDAEKNA